MMKQIAIIGPTASGKSDLALKIALKHNAYILSLDSLSIYKEIDIASAKPMQNELLQIKHFGINEIYPDKTFSVNQFIKLYKYTKNIAKQDNKNLIIAGGSTFYLKSLLQGLSILPKFSKKIKDEVDVMLLNLQKCYDLLFKIDKNYMQGIDPHDKYRIQKMLLIYKTSGMTPSQWFKSYPVKPIITNLKIYNIEIDKQVLAKKIRLRTEKMLQLGLVDEVAYLEHKYTRKPKSLKAIGIIEVLDYLDGNVTKQQMIDNIILHTTQLAKRQITFNKTQFKVTLKHPLTTMPMENFYRM